jgi:predicted sulfurtransferase
VEQHRAWLEQQGLDVRGRIYLSSQGVNAQFGGLKEQALAYTRYFQQDPRFQVCPGGAVL